MEVKYNVTGARRKELVGAVSEIIDCPANYMGAPSFAYEIGDFTIDKAGTLSFDNMTDSKLVEELLEELAKRGFEFEEPSESLTIEMPLEDFTDAALDNLNRLIASKATLIKKAIGTDNLRIERSKTTLRFPWFSFGASGEEVGAYSHFIGSLCAAAKTQQRVIAAEKPAENEKYAFRCFLLRLGFIGDEYKEVRKILLKKLSGNAAFKSEATKLNTCKAVDEDE